MSDWLLILGMMLVTFVPRYLPFVLVDHFKLPPLLMGALPYISIAVLSAIVSQNIFFLNGNMVLSVGNERIVAALIAFVVACFTKSMMLTVMLGLVSFFVLRYFF